MGRLLISIMIFCVLFLSGCGIIAKPAPVETQPPVREGEWTIKMVHSGGIIGLSRSIEISSDGTYTVTDGRTGQTKEGRLSEEDLIQLTQLVTSIQYSPGNRPSGCADCFIYEIEISRPGKTFTAQADDVTLAESGLGPLVMDLRAIMDRELN